MLADLEAELLETINGTNRPRRYRWRTTALA